ncbi:MAG: CehA/McbA family metallohydrolase, partial [Myxococcota bacterium]
PESGADFLDFDVLEVMNRFSRRGWIEVRADWFSLMNRGHQVTGTGNSDSHTAHLERVGFPVNLVNVGAAGEEGLFAAIADGQVRVSTGPLVEMNVRSGSHVYAPGEQIVPGASATEVTVSVKAVPWVPVDEVRVIVNGEVVFRADIDDAQTISRGTWTIPLTLTKDSWVIAEAGWPLGRATRPEANTYSRVAFGHVPVGFTNPVWLDVDNNGVWDVPATVEPVGPVPQ